MREKEQRRWEEAWARRKAREKAHQAWLERLEATEKTAAQWQRARRLRAYADALEGSATGAAAAQRAADVAWIRAAADRVDRLVPKTGNDEEDQANDGD